ncbi:MAG TPA: hypothetical protein DCZ94_20050 [Lentisphaeria bacterium]|nr:MAG: hypothetical protein A2X48_14695 [Lentisphaerae bacterium GWF2_49_21]HBC89239.1 hypothetical protein [Lentisphaeria bacterium]
MNRIGIRKFSEIAEVCSRCPDVLVFEENFNIPQGKVTQDEFSYKKDTSFPAYSYLEHVPYPYRRSPAHDELTPLLRLVRAGKSVILKLSPSMRNSLSFALDFLGSLYHDIYDVKQSLWLAYSRLEYTPEDSYSGLPVPVGKVAQGRNEVFLWTRRWDFSLKQIESLFPDGTNKSTRRCLKDLDKLLSKRNLGDEVHQGRRLLDEIEKTINNIPVLDPVKSKAKHSLMDMLVKSEGNAEFLTWSGMLNQLVSRHPNLPNRARCPSDVMLKPERAWPENEDSASAKIIEKESFGWPVTFIVPFDKGRVIICPAAWDEDRMEGIINNRGDESCPNRSGKRPRIQQKAESETENCIKPTKINVTLVEISDKILDTKRLNILSPMFKVKIEFSECFPGLPAVEHGVSGAAFLKFILIWCASVHEGGIAFLPGSIKRFKSKESLMRDAGYELAMMRSSDGKKVKPLSCGSLFYEGNPSNIQGDDVMETIFKVLFNCRSVEELIEDQRSVLEAVLGRKIKNRKESGEKVSVRLNGGDRLEYSVEKLNNLQVVISQGLFEKLKKLTLGEKIRGYKMFNKEKNSFYKILEKYL